MRECNDLSLLLFHIHSDILYNIYLSLAYHPRAPFTCESLFAIQ